MDDDNLKNCTSQLLPELSGLNSSEMLDALATMLNSHRDRATLKIMLHDCLYPNNSHPYFLPWWQKAIWTSLFGAMLLVSTTGNTTVIWIVLGVKMTTCKRSESSESDLQDYVITGCSSAISLKRELSCYALATLNDWGDSVARLSDWGDSVARLTSDMTELHVNQGDKKASWNHNVELACSLEEINDSFSGCISAIASRIAFASGDDEEMFEYMKEQSVSSLQSELHDVDGAGLVDAVQSLNLSSSAPKNGNSEHQPNCFFKQ